MVAINRLLIAIVLAIMSTASAQTFDYNVNVDARAGGATLVSYPHTDGKSTVYEFSTKQVGVVQRTQFRVAFQWLRNIDKPETTTYESVAFQLNVPLDGDIDDNALQVVQGGLDYGVFTQRYGGGLSLNDYIKAVLFNKTGFVQRAQTSRFLISRQYVKNYLGTVEVRLNWIMPTVEPYGEHQIWFRWAFYNPYTVINPYTGLNSCQYGIDCLGPSTLDGQDLPYQWVKNKFLNGYESLTNYFTNAQRDWTIGMYWVMTVCSLFGIVGWIPQIGIRIYLQGYLLWNSWAAYQNYLLHADEIAKKSPDIIWYLVGYNFWHTVFMNLMNFFEPWFLIGTPLDLVVTIAAWLYVDSLVAAETTTVGRQEIVAEAEQALF